MAGAGFTRIFREGTATSKGAKGSSFRNPKSIMAASGAGEEDEGLQCGHFVASPRSGYKRLGKEEDRALRVDNIYGTQSTSVERIDAGSGLNTSLLSPDEQSEAARGHERVAPRERHSSSASSLSLSSSSSSSAAVHHGPFSHSRTERSAPSQPISLGRKPFETASHGRRPHNRSASCNSDASGRIRCGNFASGRAAAIAWEELNMTQDALRETMDDLRELVSRIDSCLCKYNMGAPRNVLHLSPWCLSLNAAGLNESVCSVNTVVTNQIYKAFSFQSLERSDRNINWRHPLPPHTHT